MSPLAVSPVAHTDNEYDISRIVSISNAFPRGFHVEVQPLRTLGPGDVDDSTAGLLAGAGIDPPQCRPLIVSLYSDTGVSRQVAGVIADRDRSGIDVFAVRSATPLPVGQALDGCDRVVVAGDPEVAGVVERVPAPDIAGVTTTAVKLTADEQPPDPEYFFTAVLDDRTAVSIAADDSAVANPEKFLSDLLVKAVAAVREQ